MSHLGRAQDCAVFNRLRRLTEWVGTGKQVTATAVLRPADVPAAADAMGIDLPVRIRSAAELHELHIPWIAAQALGLLRIHEDRVIRCETREIGDDEWLTAFAAVLGSIFDDEEGVAAIQIGRDVLTTLNDGVPFCRYTPALLDLLTDFAAVDDYGQITERGLWALHEISTRDVAFNAVDLVPADQICQLRITLRYVRPSSWRKVLVPAPFTLGYLHQIIQVVMSWEANCPHLFTVGRRHFEATDHDELSIGEAFTISRKTIIYDFGADWRHEITLEKVVDAVPGARYPRCVASSAPCDVDELNRQLLWLTTQGDAYSVV